MARHCELLHREPANEMNGRTADSDSGSPLIITHRSSAGKRWELVRARVHRLAKCNKCTRESNKRQTPMMNRQTISVPSATSGDLFVIKDETTINPVERIYQRLVAPRNCCLSSLRGSKKTIMDTDATVGFGWIYASIISSVFHQLVFLLVFFFFFFLFWGVVYLLAMSSNSRWVTDDCGNLCCSCVYNCNCYCID